MPSSNCSKLRSGKSRLASFHVQVTSENLLETLRLTVTVNAPQLDQDSRRSEARPPSSIFHRTHTQCCALSSTPHEPTEFYMPQHAQALETLQVLSVFVAFVTVLFGLRYPAMSAAARTALPDETKPEARALCQNQLRTQLQGQLYLTLVVIALPAYLFLPLCCSIVSDSTLKLWRFDTITTGFVLLTGYLVGLTIWTAGLVFTIASKVGLRRLIHLV